MTHNRITLTDELLVVEPVGLDRLWTFTRRVELPLRHVRGATFDPGVRHEPAGWRGPGLRLPGRLAGTFHRGGRRQFWNVAGYDRVVVIVLDDSQPWDRVIVTADDPQALVDEVNARVS